MPLFFLLSGAGSWYALTSRTAGQYLLERIKRILIHLYGVGACILLLPQAYFEAITNGGYTGTFWEGLPLQLRPLPALMIHFSSIYSMVISGFFSIFFSFLCWFCRYSFFSDRNGAGVSSRSWPGGVVIGAAYFSS